MSCFKVGFARADLAPVNGLCIAGYFSTRHGTGILDDLTASCLAFSDGERTAVVFTIDVIGISQKYGDELRKLISEKTGLPYEAVYYACTHTHTAPTVTGSAASPRDPEWIAVMFSRIADAAVEAVADLDDAELYTARGKVEGISFIRRYKMKDGTTRTNPGKGNPEIDHPIGTPDEMLQLVKIVRANKDDIAIVNFQVHPDVIGGCRYSSDWPGWVRRSFEGAVPGTKCLMFNGAQGDTNHISVAADSKIVKGYTHSRHMGLCIAGEVMKLWTYADKLEGDVKVDFGQYELEVPSHRGKAEDIPTAEKYIAAHEAGEKEVIPSTGMGYTTLIAWAYRVKRLENGPDSFTLHLNAVRFGDIVFAGVPGEPFTDIGRGIKDGSPFYMTLVNCCANGSEGYYPMQSAYDEGGYEANTSKFAPGVAERIIEGSVKLLKQLY